MTRSAWLWVVGEEMRCPALGGQPCQRAWEPVSTRIRPQQEIAHQLCPHGGDETDRNSASNAASQGKRALAMRPVMTLARPDR